jgi:hypothetical protein
LASEIETVSAADVREKLQLCGLLMGGVSVFYLGDFMLRRGEVATKSRPRV